MLNKHSPLHVPQLAANNLSYNLILFWAGFVLAEAFVVNGLLILDSYSV